VHSVPGKVHLQVDVGYHLTLMLGLQATQKALPPQAPNNTQRVLGLVQSWKASEDRKDGPGTGTRTPGSSAATDESTESQVQSQVGVTVLADGLRTSVEHSAGKPAEKLPAASSSAQQPGTILTPLQEAQISEISKRPTAEILRLATLPSLNPKNPLLAHADVQASAGQASESTFTAAASASPGIESSPKQSPVHQAQPPQLAEQQLDDTAAEQSPGEPITTGQQGQVGTPAGSAQEASNAPQAAAAEQEHPQVQMTNEESLLRSSSFLLKHLSASSKTAEEIAKIAAPSPVAGPAGPTPVATPAAPIRRVLLPKVPMAKLPKPAGRPVTPPQPVSTSAWSLKCHHRPFIQVVHYCQYACLERFWGPIQNLQFDCKQG